MTAETSSDTMTCAQHTADPCQTSRLQARHGTAPGQAEPRSGGRAANSHAFEPNPERLAGGPAHHLVRDVLFQDEERGHDGLPRKKHQLRLAV
jgi:hypothetical protein